MRKSYEELLNSPLMQELEQKKKMWVDTEGKPLVDPRTMGKRALMGDIPMVPLPGGGVIVDAPKVGMAEALGQLGTATKETGVGLAKGMAGFVLSGYAGLGALPWGLDAAAKAVEETQEDWAPKVTHPLTEGALDIVTSPFVLLHEGSQWAGQKVRDLTGDDLLGTEVAVGLEGAGLVLGPKLLTKFRKALRTKSPSLLKESIDILRESRKASLREGVGDVRSKEAVEGILRQAEEVVKAKAETKSIEEPKVIESKVKAEPIIEEPIAKVEEVKPAKAIKPKKKDHITNLANEGKTRNEIAKEVYGNDKESSMKKLSQDLAEQSDDVLSKIIESEKEFERAFERKEGVPSKGDPIEDINGSLALVDGMAEKKFRKGEKITLDKMEEELRSVYDRFTEENFESLDHYNTMMEKVGEQLDKLKKIRESDKFGEMFPDEPRTSLIEREMEKGGAKGEAGTKLYSGVDPSGLYKGFVDRFKKVKEKFLTDADLDMLSKGKILHQRTWKSKGVKYKAPPVMEAKLKTLMSLKNLRQTNFNRSFTNPQRTFHEAAGDPITADALDSMTTWAYNAADKKYIQGVKESIEWVKKIKKGLTFEERRTIGAADIGRQYKGPQLLEAQGIKEVPGLSTKLQNVLSLLDKAYEEFYWKISKTRVEAGKEPLPKRQNYSAFFREVDLAERLGMKPLQAKHANVLNRQFVKMRESVFGPGKERTSALYKVDLDPFRRFEKYVDLAHKYINLTPMIAELREYLYEVPTGKMVKDVVTNKMVPETFLLSRDNPIAYAAINSWLNHLAGKKITVLSPTVEGWLQRVNSNLVASILGANVRTALIQLSALRNTYTEVGFTHTMEGIGSMFKEGSRKFALKNSDVLLQATYDATVEEALSSIRSGRVGEMQQAAARASMWPLKMLDAEARIATWYSGYKSALKKGMHGKRAFQEADRIVVDTQASARPGHVAPVQRTTVGKFFTMFQTFQINDWNFLLRDCLGRPDAALTNRKQFVKVMRYVAGTAMFNILMEDILGIQTPFPSPIGAFRKSLENGDDVPSMMVNVGKELMDPIPILSSTRYGKDFGGPGLDLMNEVRKYLMRDPMAKPGWELAGKLGGVPGTGQVAKTLRARKRGENPWGQVVGTYSPKKKGSKATKVKGGYSGYKGMKGYTSY